MHVLSLNWMVWNRIKIWYNKPTNRVHRLIENNYGSKIINYKQKQQTATVTSAKKIIEKIKTTFKLN